MDVAVQHVQGGKSVKSCVITGTPTGVLRTTAAKVEQRYQASQLTKKRKRPRPQWWWAESEPSMYITKIDPKAAINDLTLAPYFSGPALQQVVTPSAINPELDVRAVFFDKGARSQWHRHPFPQIIHVLSGVGLVGTDDAEQEVRPGEIVTFPAQT